MTSYVSIYVYYTIYVIYKIISNKYRINNCNKYIFIIPICAGREHAQEGLVQHMEKNRLNQMTAVSHRFASKLPAWVALFSDWSPSNALAHSLTLSLARSLAHSLSPSPPPCSVWCNPAQNSVHALTRQSRISQHDPITAMTSSACVSGCC